MSLLRVLFFSFPFFSLRPQQYFPDTKEGSPDMIFKETVARYVMAAYALTCYSAIGNDPKK